MPELEGVKITVGSKDFTEQIILGYIIEFALSAAGANVRDLTNIQGSDSSRDAQLAGQIDVDLRVHRHRLDQLPEQREPIPDEQEQFEAVRDEDLQQNGMVWLPYGADEQHLRVRHHRGLRRAEQPAHASRT